MKNTKASDKKPCEDYQQLKERKMKSNGSYNKKSCDSRSTVSSDLASDLKTKRRHDACRTKTGSGLPLNAKHFRMDAIKAIHPQSAAKQSAA